MPEPSEYVLEPIRESAEFTLYRGRQHGNTSPLLAVALSAEQPSPQGLRRLEHEYSIAAELDPAWAAMPPALTRHEGPVAIGLATTFGQVHWRGLIPRICTILNVLPALGIVGRRS